MTTLFLHGLTILLSSLVGTLGFALLLHAPKRAWLPASLIGAGAYTLAWALNQAGLPMTGGVLIGATLGSLLAQICARRMRMIATVFITLSIVAMVPGLGLYRCMALLAQGQNAEGVRVGVEAMSIILMIALGLGLGSFLFRICVGHRRARPE